MSTLTFTFDTLKYSKRLTEAGLPAKVAEAEAEILCETPSAALGAADLATKQDLSNFEIRLTAHADRSVSNAKTGIIKWLAVLMIAQVTAIAVLVKPI